MTSSGLSTGTLRTLSDRPRIYVDFNEMVESDLVRLAGIRHLSEIDV